MPPYSLTQALLASDPAAFHAATHSPFLSNASRGRVSKPFLSQWLANDRLYIHAYTRAIGRLISSLHHPETVPPLTALPAPDAGPSRQLLHWMIDALANIYREEGFFIDTAREYGLDINLAGAKLEGLVRFEALFDGLTPTPSSPLPWLDFAVVFWGTEKCYLDAWSRARAATLPPARPDDDGGALRDKLMPNWTSDEFSRFVDRLAAIIDAAVDHHQRQGGCVDDILNRALPKWRQLLDAERTFWPAMEE